MSTVRRHHAARQAGPTPKASLSSNLESCHARQHLPGHPRRSRDRATLAGRSHSAAGWQARRSSEAARCALMTACTSSFAGVTIRIGGDAAVKRHDDRPRLIRGNCRYRPESCVRFPVQTDSLGTRRVIGGERARTRPQANSLFTVTSADAALWFGARRLVCSRP
jgi:hypothetical protein